jgi:hypothetical protein
MCYLPHNVDTLIVEIYDEVLANYCALFNKLFMNIIELFYVSFIIKEIYYKR